MLAKGVTLRGIEVFEALARSGSVAHAAELTGLSQPAVSQQLRNLEAALGADLVDHGRRPMRLTPAGQSFLTRAERALSELHLAQSELTVMDLTHLSVLNMGLIDDFDNDVTPRLATRLAENMTRCRFKLITLSSHEIGAAMQARELHLAVAASTGIALDGVVEYPLVRDPFLLIAPRGAVDNRSDIEPQLRDLPFLRYAREQLISRQIAAHLAPIQLQFEERFEIGSNPALMAMVSRGIGWAVTTPLSYMRAVRFQDEIDAFPLPFGSFARTISLLVSADWADSVPREVGQMVRRLAQEHMIAPAIDRLPWLSGDLRLIEPKGTPPEASP